MMMTPRSFHKHNLTTLCLALFAALQYTHVVVVVTAQDNNNDEVCSLCFGGDDANLTATVGGAVDGVPCSALTENLVGIDPTSCRDLQLLGFRYCDCPSYPTEHYCPMCEGSFTNIPVRFQAIPGTQDTCDDRLFVSMDDVDGDCALAQKPGFACGCPNAQPPACQICAGTSNDVTNMSLDGILVQTIGSFTCQEWADQAVLGDLSDTDQCALVTEAVADICCSVVEEEEEDTTAEDSDIMGDPEESLVVESDNNDSVNATDPPEDVEAPAAPENNDSSAASAFGSHGSVFFMVVAIRMTMVLL